SISAFYSTGIGNVSSTVIGLYRKVVSSSYYRLYRSTVILKRFFLLLSTRPRFGSGPSYYCLYSTEIRKRSFLLLFILDRDSGAVLPTTVYTRPRFGSGPSYCCLYSTEIRKRSFLLQLKSQIYIRGLVLWVAQRCGLQIAIFD